MKIVCWFLGHKMVGRWREQDSYFTVHDGKMRYNGERWMIVSVCRRCGVVYREIEEEGYA